MSDVFTAFLSLFTRQFRASSHSIPPTSKINPQSRATAISLSNLTSYRSSYIFRINSEYYDLTTYVDKHPGGKEFLRYAKYKCWDHTTLFAIHHLNYNKIVLIMKQFKIHESSILHKIRALEIQDLIKYWPNQLPKQQSIYNLLPNFPPNKLLSINDYSNEKHWNCCSKKNCDNYGNLYQTVEWTSEVLKVADYNFELPKKDSFYYELRAEVYKYFKTNNLSYAPSFNYLLLFYFFIAMIFVCTSLQHWYRSYLLAIIIGFLYAFAGGYGHQFCHLPDYRKQAHILDWMGLYSHAYLVDHVFLHHIHTNTIADTHFEGTDPFLYVHPYFQRQWFRKTFNFVFANIALMFGIWGNYSYNIQNILRGKEEFHWCLLLYPLNYALIMIITDPLNGFILCTISTFFVSWYYFSIALMNHNQKENWNLDEIWNAKNWAEMELITCTDIGYDYGYIGSMMCLWLNYHAVHHLLPTVDMCHHQNVQKILKRISNKHGITYHYKPIIDMYFNMIETFSISRAYELITQL